MATVKVTPELVREEMAKIDWAAVDAQTDDDIVRNVAADPDAAPILDEAQTATALVRSIRKRFGLSQQQFSERFLVPVGTLRDWEQGRKKPDGASLAYLRVINHDPRWVARALRQAAA